MPDASSTLIGGNPRRSRRSTSRSGAPSLVSVPAWKSQARHHRKAKPLKRDQVHPLQGSYVRAWRTSPRDSSEEPIVPDWRAAHAVKKAMYAQWLSVSQAAGALHTLQKAVDEATLAVVLAENRRRLGLLLPVDPRLDAARNAAQVLKEPYERAWETWSQASRTLDALRPRLDDERQRAITAAQNHWLERQYPAIVEEIHALTRRIALGNGSRGVELVLQETRDQARRAQARGSDLGE